MILLAAGRARASSDRSPSRPDPSRRPLGRASTGPARPIRRFLSMLAVASCLGGCSGDAPSTPGSERGIPFTLGGPRLESLGQGEFEAPELAIVKPSAKAKFKSHEEILCEAELRVADPKSIPGLMYATFYSGSTIHGQFYLDPDGRTEDGIYHFAARIKAPRASGTYALRAEAKYTIVPPGDAPPKVVRFPSKDIPIEVQ